MFHRPGGKAPDIAAFSIIMIVITVLSAAGRVISRRMMGNGWGADDTCFLIGSVLATATFTVSTTYAFEAGLGEHWAYLNANQQALFVKLNYAYNILNVAAYPFIKMSIIFLFLRIFGVDRRFRLIARIALAFMAAYLTAMTLVAIFSCDPPRAFFDPSVQPLYCIDTNAFSWAQATLNVVTDLIVIVLPIHQIWRLRMTLKKKIALAFLFSLGGVTLIISILRIVFYVRFDPTDPSYSFIPAAFASPAEVVLAILIANAPTWRPLYERLVIAVGTQFSRVGSGRDHSGGSNESLTTKKYCEYGHPVVARNPPGTPCGQQQQQQEQFDEGGYEYHEKKEQGQRDDEVYIRNDVEVGREE